MTSVFISHASDDFECIEREILGHLQAHRIKAWYSQNSIRGAAQFEREILEGLRKTNWFMVAMSPRSGASEWVRDEVHWAMSNRLGRVIPVLLNTCDPLDFHLRMPRLERIDFRSNRDQARLKLLEAFRLPTTAQLLANLDVLVLRGGVPRWMERGGHNGDLLPLRRGDHVKLQIRLNRPAYPYLVWISSGAAPIPIYPWTRGDWQRRPARERPVSKLQLPPGGSDVAWPVIPASTGHDTVLLMARESPLPLGNSFKKMLDGLPDSKFPFSNVCVSMDSCGPGRSRIPMRSIDVARPRRVHRFNPPLFDALLTRLSPHAEVIVATSFVTRY